MDSIRAITCWTWNGCGRLHHGMHMQMDYCHINKGKMRYLLLKIFWCYGEVFCVFCTQMVGCFNSCN